MGTVRGAQPPLTPPATSSEDPLHAALEHIHDAVVAYDRDWRYVYLNRGAEQYVGAPRESLLGKVVWEAFPTAAGTPLEAAFRGAAVRDEPTEFEILGPVKGRHLVIRAHPWSGGLVCFFRDVTEQREAEQALRVSEERYRSIFENSLEGMLLTRSTGEILAANPAACRMLARTEAEIRAEGRAGVVDASDPRLGAFLEERARVGKARGEVRLRRRDGTTFLAAVSSAVFSGVAGEGLTSMSIVDLTERKRGERALEFLAEAGAALSASLDYEKTLQALTGLVVPSLADLCVVDVIEGDHARRAAVAHRSPEAAPLLDPLRAADPSGEGGVADVLRTGEPVFVPVCDEAWLSDPRHDPAYVAAARALKAVSLVMAPMSAGGRRVGVLSLARVAGGDPYDAFDASVARRLADLAALAIENARNYRDAVEARRLRDEMLGVVSHDLRSPLNAISLSAVILARRFREAGPTIESIRRSLQHADRLIEDLLMIARVDEGRLTLERSRERVPSLFGEVLMLQRPYAETKSIRLEASVAPGVPEVLVDPHQLVRLLGNLVANAVKFSPEGARVSLAATTEPGRVVLSVSDTGPGIRAEDQPHLFDRFWQGAHARRAGAGLGLAIVKGIAEAHGGSVAVQSEVGRGTTFEVTLPTADA